MNIGGFLAKTMLIKNRLSTEPNAGGNANNGLSVSRALTMIAIALWLFSLSQPALIIDNGNIKPSIWIGASVLATGWMGIGLFTAGWYANLPFLIAVNSLLFRSESPWKSVFIGILLALDTFRLKSLPGGGRADVYAYGTGVALWFAAFGLLLLAAAWRSAEQNGYRSISATLRSRTVLLALAVLSCSSALYGVYAYRTTQYIGVTESEFLPVGSVKALKVCSTAIAVPKTKIELKGPLEISGNAYPLDAPATLLGWGIPIVRKDGFDYALYDSTDINSIYWKPASGPASAVLILSTRDSNDTIDAALTSADGKVTSFQQRWTRDSHKTSLYCPDFRPSDSDLSSAPRSLLISAVNVPNGLTPPTGVLRNAITVVPFRRESLPIAKTIGLRKDTAEIMPALDGSCSADTHFVDKDPGAANFGYSGEQTFAIGERRYFLMNNQLLNAVCSGDSVYLYYFSLDNNQKPHLLYIQRRNLADFSKVWSLVTGFDYERPYPSKGKPNVKIRSLSEMDGRVAAEIVDADQSLVVDISFPAPAR